MRRYAWLAAAPVLATAIACSSGGSSAAGPAEHSPGPAAGRSVAAAAKPTFSSWPTYGRTDARSAHTSRGLGTLHRSWRDTLDGAVYGEPLVVGSTLIVATENDTVYGLDARTGKHRWRRHLARPESQRDLQGSLPGCGDIFPSGITGTPVYDAKTGSVYAVTNTDGGHHRLWALAAATGAVRWHRSLDVLPHQNRRAEQERSALLVTDGRVIATFGGVAGDCGQYVGYVTSIPASGHGAVRHYAVPTSREAGMWSPAGPVTGADGNVYVASGNGAELHGRWDKSDSVTELTPAALHRVAVFAPTTWAQDNQDDLDLGSSSPVPVDHRIVIAGKRGTVYLLKPGLGGVGADIATATGCQAFGGAAVSGHTVLMPCKGQDAIRALKVGSHSLSWSWTASGVYASPVVAGKRVYAADLHSGDLVVLRLSTGAVVQRLSAGSLPHFPSETVDGGRVFVGTLSGVTAFAAS